MKWELSLTAARTLYYVRLNECKSHTCIKIAYTYNCMLITQTV